MTDRTPSVLKAPMTADLWLVQYLCPLRHAIVAAPYDHQVQTPLEIEAALLREITHQGIDPWCGLCGSHELHFEHKRMRVQDPDEALKLLRESEHQQKLTRSLLRPNQN